MDSLKQRLMEKLDHLLEPELNEVLDFVNFLSWRRINHKNSSQPVIDDELRKKQDAMELESDVSDLGNYEPYDWQPGELGEGRPVRYVPEMGVVIVEE